MLKLVQSMVETGKTEYVTFQHLLADPSRMIQFHIHGNNPYSAATENNGKIDPQALHQANGIPGHLLDGNRGRADRGDRPRAPAPVSEGALPGSRVRLAATRRTARPGRRAPAGQPK